MLKSTQKKNWKGIPLHQTNRPGQGFWKNYIKRNKGVGVGGTT